MDNGQGGFERRLVNIKRPLLRVPTLCIHLQSAEERKAFGPNKETNLTPILGLVESNLNVETTSTDERHAPVLLNLLAEELGCEPDQIKDLELTLADTQPGAVWGVSGRKLFISMKNKCKILQKKCCPVQDLTTRVIVTRV